LDGLGSDLVDAVADLELGLAEDLTVWPTVPAIPTAAGYPGRPSALRKLPDRPMATTKWSRKKADAAWNCQAGSMCSIIEGLVI
jgi:hypothetical protein